MTITLKREAVCAQCGAKLEAGQEARWYRNGAVYGLACHPQITKPRASKRAVIRRDRGEVAQAATPAAKYAGGFSAAQLKKIQALIAAGLI